jgi:hypothetical protein
MRNGNWVWLVLLLLLTTWLGARSLDADAIWYDEYRSLFYAGGVEYGPIQLPEVWTRVALYGGSAQVPGYFSLLWGWGALVGWTEFAARSLSLFCGLLAVAWTYRLGALILSPRGGLFAAAILGVSAFFIHYLHELRVYTLLALMTAFTLWAYWRIVSSRREPSIVMQISLLAGVTLSLYIHYLTSLTLIALGFYHLLFVPKNRRWWRVTAILAAGAVLFLPWAGVLIEGVSSKTRDSVAANIGVVVNNIAHSLSNDSLILLGVVLTLAALSWKTIRFPAFLTIGVLALGLALNRWLRIGDTRYYMALWPLFALVAAGAMLRLQKTPFKPEYALGVWMAVAIFTTFRLDFIGAYAGVNLISSVFPYRAAVRAISPYTQPDDLVAFAMPDSVIARQQWEIVAHYMHDLDTRYDLTHTIVASDVGLQFGLEELDDSPERVWTAYVPPATPLLAEYESILEAEYIPCGSVVNGQEIALDLYATCAVCCPPEDAERDAPYRFGDDILISGLESLPDEVSGSLAVRLGWVVPEDAPRHTYSVALHVEDTAGNLVAQMDYGLPEQLFSCSPVTLDLSGVPDGEYQLLVTVYAWETGERLPGVVTATGETGDRLVLGTFRVRGS